MTGMTRYALRRILFFMPVLLAVSAITFFGLALIPGDPAQLFLPIDAENEAIEEWRASRGLDQPLVERYINWLGGMLRGDPGPALVSGVPIHDEIAQRWPVSMLVLVFTFFFSTTLGLLFGSLSAVFQDSWLDYFVRTFSIFGLSTPSFFLLTLLLVLPAVWWGYAPPFGYVPFWEDPGRAARQIIPPTLLLSIGGAGSIARLVRSSLLEVLRQDFITTARSKGLTERAVLVRHAIRNAAIPLLTVFGGMIGGLLGGSVILENITALPGLGQYTFNAVIQRDTNVVMAMTTYSAVLLVSSHLIVDLLYGWADPRIRYE